MFRKYYISLKLCYMILHPCMAFVLFLCVCLLFELYCSDDICTICCKCNKCVKYVQIFLYIVCMYIYNDSHDKRTINMHIFLLTHTLIHVIHYMQHCSTMELFSRHDNHVHATFLQFSVLN